MERAMRTATVAEIRRLRELRKLMVEGRASAEERQEAIGIMKTWTARVDGATARG